MANWVYFSNNLKHNKKLIFETWKQKMVTMAAPDKDISPHSLPQMNSYRLRLLTKSATKSKYLR
jgi:hypothetical protein